MSALPDIDAAIAANDLDELVRVADRLADVREWDALELLRRRAQQAFHDTGRQMWPAATRAEYLLALRGPAPYAARVLTDDTGFLGLGPIAEVVASTHSWADLAPHAPATPAAALCAHERVVRGEVIDGGPPVPLADVLDVPLALAPWEPAYFLATYRDHEVVVDGPAPWRGRPLALSDPPPAPVAEPLVTDALAALAREWTVRSEGVVRAVAVEGDAATAIRALGHRRAWAAPIAASEAVAWMAWAAASGGRHGRRRGAAVGRDAAWAVLRAVAGAEPHETVGADELGAVVGELRAVAFRSDDVPHDWSLRLVLEDRVEGVCYAVDAVDHAGDAAGTGPVIAR